MFRFSNVPACPVPSLARGFSAPVKVEVERDGDELVFLIANETDPFNRWDAVQEYSTKLMLGMIEERLAGAKAGTGAGDHRLAGPGAGAGEERRTDTGIGVGRNPSANADAGAGEGRVAGAGAGIGAGEVRGTDPGAGAGQDRLAGSGADTGADLPDEFVSALHALLLDEALDPAFIAEALTLPSESNLADRMETIAVEAIHEVREAVKATLARRLADAFASVREANRLQGPYRFEAEDAGRRALGNLCLGYLMELDDPAVWTDCGRQLESADNMTDTLAALACFANSPHGWKRDRWLDWFEERWKDDPLVLDKWFSLQATSRQPGAIHRVRRLMRHRAFDIENPNRVRALIGAFCHGNQRRFHDASGEGYIFLSSYVLAIDAFNPQTAARLLGAASHWRRLDPDRRALLRAELEHVRAAPGLSKDCYEVVSKFLA